MAYSQLCREFKFNRARLIQIDPLFKSYADSNFQVCRAQMKPGTYFVCTGGGFPEGSTYWFTVVRTEKKLYVFHSELLQIIEVVGNAHAARLLHNPTEEDWKSMFIDIGVENFILSHYDYLELVIDDFWKAVFGKTTDEMWCGGIIGAHGDKAYGYDSTWKEAGIPFRHGVLLFLLTYTKELGDTPKHKSAEWVIDNYQKYLPHIKAAEKLAGL